MAMSIQPLIIIVQCALLITGAWIARELSVFVVSNYGVAAGLVLLLAIFGVGIHLDRS